jgi:hypothetical protein
MPSKYRLITVEPKLSHSLRTVGNTVGSLSGVQHAIIIGSLLGDGALRCKTNALLEINHCFAQRGYVDWKYRNLAALTKTPPCARQGNGGRVAYRFVTRSLSELTPYYRLFYESGLKGVPEVELSPLALAVWFMDDGSRSRNAVYLNTQQFDLTDQIRLVSMLKSQWSIDATLNRDKQYQRIRVSVKGTRRFRQIIRDYVRPEFRYKLPQVTP